MNSHANKLKLRKGADKAVNQAITRKLMDLRCALDADTLDDELVHQARQETKKLRALLKLVRDRLGKSRYRQFNSTLRDSARELSDLRDAKVLHETLVGILPPDQQQDSAWQGLLGALQDDYENIEADTVQPDRLKDLRGELESLIQELRHWPQLPPGYKAFKPSLKRTYRRGRQALAASLEQPSTPQLHDLRKRAKNLRYQLHYLRRVWPTRQKAAEQALNQLSDLLGEDHDLAELSAWLDRHDWPETPKPRRQTLKQSIADKRQDLQRRALLLAQLIYTEKPKAFVKRQGDYYGIARRHDFRAT